jgi:hypothetical protein
MGGSIRMAAQAGLANMAREPLMPELAGEVRYVARQPILDLQGACMDTICSSGMLPS